MKSEIVICGNCKRNYNAAVLRSCPRCRNIAGGELSESDNVPTQSKKQELTQTNLLTESTGKLILEQARRQTFELQEINGWIKRVIWSLGIGGAAFLVLAIFLFSSASQ